MKTEHVVLRISAPIWEMCQSDWEAEQLNVPKVTGAEKNHTRTQCGNQEPIMPAALNNTWPDKSGRFCWSGHLPSLLWRVRSHPETWTREILTRRKRCQNYPHRHPCICYNNNKKNHMFLTAQGKPWSPKDRVRRREGWTDGQIWVTNTTHETLLSCSFQNSLRN